MTSFGCTVELFQKQINKPFAALISSPESREISNPWCKGRFSDWCHTEFPVSERDRDTGLVNFLHFYISKRKTSSKFCYFCYFYWLHYHLDNAAEGREGWAGSLNEDRKKNMSIPRHSHSRNSPNWSTIWVPKPCVVSSADTWLHSWHATYQTNTKLTKLQTRHLRSSCFHWTSQVFFSSQGNPKRSVRSPRPNLPANEAKGSSLKEKQHVSLIAGTKTTVAPAFLLSTRISPALGNLRC